MGGLEKVGRWTASTRDYGGLRATAGVSYTELQWVIRYNRSKKLTPQLPARWEAPHRLLQSRRDYYQSRAIEITLV